MTFPNVYLNGRIVARTEALIPALDQGLLFGLGAFETLRSYGGHIFRLRAHLSRLYSTLDWLGIRLPESSDGLALAAQDLVARSGLTDSRIRITVTAGPSAKLLDGEPTRLIEVRPLDAPPPPAYRDGVAAVRHRVHHGLGPLAGRKVTSFLPYLMARRVAERAGAVEALLEDHLGRMVEGAMSNLFIVHGGRVRTPPLSDGPLPGITRQVVLELLRPLNIAGREQSLTWEDLLGAEEIFLTASVAEILPVTRLDGRFVGQGQPGPVTQRLLAAYRDLASIAR